jgi:fibronectin type 3 domain-containing protein
VTVTGTDGTWPFQLLSGLTSGFGSNVPVSSPQDNIYTLGVPGMSASFLGTPVSFNGPGDAVSLSWAQVTGESSQGYVLTRSPGGGSFGTVTLLDGASVPQAVLIPSATTTTYVDAAATNLTGFTYTLSPYNAVARGPVTSFGPVTAFANPGVPSVTALTGGATVQLSWNAPSSVSGSYPVSGYQVFRNGSAATTIISAASAVTFMDTGLSAGTTYTYDVSTFDNTGNIGTPGTAHNSVVSSQATGFPPGWPPTGLPSPVPMVIAAGPSTYLGLSWTAPTNDLNTPISFYNVYKLASGGAGTYSLATTIASLLYNDSFVTIGTTYSYYVQAVDSQGVTSNNSVTVSGGLGPSAPTGLAVSTPTGPAAITLAWNTNAAGDDAVTYVISRVSSAGSTILSQASVTNVPAQTITDTTALGLQAGLNYVYTVAGVNASGTTGVYSLPVTAALLPSAPVSLGAAYTANQFNASVSWLAAPATVTNLISYNLYRNTSPVTTGSGWTTLGQNLPVSQAGSPVTSFADSTILSAGTTYFYFLQAQDISGWSPFSVAGFQMPPLAPVSLTSVSGPAVIALSWAPSASANYYKVYWGTSSPSTLLASNVTGTSYTVTTAAAGTNYVFAVSAVDTGSGTTVLGGESFQCAPVTAGLVPPAPAGLGVTLSMSVSDTAVTFGGVAGNYPVSQSYTAEVTWTAPAGTNLTSYNLYRNTVPLTTGPGWTTVGQNLHAYQAGSPVTGFADPATLSAGTTYFYFLQAVDSGGPGVFSMAGYLTPPPAPAVSAFSSSSAITLAWPAVPAAGYYVLSVINSSGGQQTIQPVTGTSYTFPGLPPATNEFFALSAVDSASGTTILGGGSSADGILVWGVLPQPVTIQSEGISLLGAANQTAVTVNWNPVTEADAQSVSLLYNTTNNPGLALGVSMAVTATTDTLTLPPDTAYYFWVETNNPYGSGSPVSPAPSTLTYPAAVSLMPITLAPDGVSRVLNWTPKDSPVTQYVVYREETAPVPGSWSAVTQLPESVTLPVTLTLPVAPSTSYDMMVAAMNPTGTGPDSNLQGFSTLPAAPASLTALSGLSPSAAAVSLSWAYPNAASEGVTAYTVYRSPSNASTATYAPVGVVTPPGTPPPPTAFIDSASTDPASPVTGLGVYYYLVAADINGVQSLLNTVNAVCVTAFASPNPPAGLTAAAFNASVSLSWTAAALTTYPVAGYKVFRSTSASVTGTTPLNPSLLASPSYNDTGVTNGTTYYYWVETVDSMGNVSSLSGPLGAEPLNQPSPPTSVSAVNGDQEVQVSWNPGTPGTLPIGSYLLYQVSAGVTAAPVTLPASSTGYVTPVTLTNGTAYVYFLQTVDSSGITTGLDISVPSASVTGVPVPGNFNMPSNFTALGGVSQVVLSYTDSWVTSGSAPVTGYQVYDSTPSNTSFGSSPLAYLGLGASPVTFSGLINGQNYYFYFVPVASGVAAPNTSVTVSAFPSLPPSMPVSLIETDHSQAVSLSWAPNTPVDGVPVTQYLYYQTPAGPVNPVTVYTASAAVTGLVNGASYVYQVQAVNAYGVTSTLSSPVTGNPYVLTAPVSLTSLGGVTALSLDWSAPVTESFPLANYDLVRDLLGGASTVTTLPLASATSAIDTTVTPDKLYAYTLQAVDNKGHVGPASNAVTDSACAPPAAPSTAVAEPGSGQVLLDWLAASAPPGSLPVSFYLIYGPNNTATPATVLANQTWYLDVPVTVTGPVTYTLVAVDDTGLASSPNHAVTYSAPLTCAPGPGLLNPPTGLSAKALPNANVQLTWTQPNFGGGNVTGFNIYRGASFGNYTKVGSIPNSALAPVTAYIDTTTWSTTTYTYVVRAVYSPGSAESPNSNHAVVTTPQAAGVPKVSPGQMAFTANLVKPLSGQKLGIYFVSPGSGPVEIRIYNIAGALVKSMDLSATAGSPENLEWDMTDRNLALVASGVYFIELRGPGGFHVVKKVAVVK